MLLDDYSSYAYCYLLRLKSDTITAVEKFFAQVQNQHDTVIKQFCSDQGGEFTSKKFDELLSSKNNDYASALLCYCDVSQHNFDKKPSQSIASSTQFCGNLGT